MPLPVPAVVTVRAKLVPPPWGVVALVLLEGGEATVMSTASTR